MAEIVDEKQRIAFWGEFAKTGGEVLKGKKILIMSSGKADAVIGAEAAKQLDRLGAKIMLGGSGEMFMSGGTAGEYAYVKALDEVDAVLMVSPIDNADDNGMIRSMRAVASKALEYEDPSNLLPGQEMQVKKSGASKVAVINPRKDSPSMRFLSEVGGGKHEIGANLAGGQLMDGLMTILSKG